MDAMRRGDNSRATMNALNRGLNGGAAAMVASEPTKPAEVAVIATDCLLGVSISDSVSTDPDSAFPPSSSSAAAASSKKKTTSDSNSKSGWRKTEYLFKLGRFVPPFMLVAKYYKDEVEEERRRNEATREYNELRDRHKKSRWDKASARDEDEKVSLTTNADNTSSSSSSKERLSEVSTRTEYYLQRIYVQMIKNMNMMSYLSTEVICKPDFPKKVQLQGQKIYDNIGPTAERTGKLMGDVWDMWMVTFLGRSKSPGNDDNNGGSKRGW